MNKGARRAFTLIELLIVISIILILLSLILPAYKPIADMILRARCQLNLRGIGTAYMLYVHEARRFPPIWHHGEYNFNNNEYASWFCPQNNYQCCVNGRFDGGFGPVIWNHAITNPDVFVCPIVLDSDFSWWHVGAIKEPANWSRETGGEDVGYYWSGLFDNRQPIKLREDLAAGSIGSPGNIFTRSCYSIRPYLHPWAPGQVETRDMAYGQRNAGGVRAILADNCSVPAQVLERHVDGVNVFYLDGTVRYIQHEILYDNNMTWNYVQNTPELGRVWRALDQAE